MVLYQMNLAGTGSFNLPVSDMKKASRVDAFFIGNNYQTYFAAWHLLLTFNL